MNEYLSKIATHLKLKHKLNSHFESDEKIVWFTESVQNEFEHDDIVTRQNCTGTFLVYYKEKDYLDFHKKDFVRFLSSGVEQRIVNEAFGKRITVDSNSIKPLMHNYRGRDVKYISLKNWHNLKDDKLARLIIGNSSSLDWIENLNVKFYDIPLKELRKLGSVTDFIKYFTKTDVPKKLYDIMQIDDIIYMYGVVSINFITKVMQYIYDNKPANITMPNLLIEYYKDLFKEQNGVRVSEIRDYVEMCRANEEKVNLAMKSFSRLKEEHDRLMVALRLKKMPEVETDEIYKVDLKMPGVTFELVNSKKRLLQEGVSMKNCVASYTYKINHGLCAIYHVVHEENNYTLEVGRVKNELYVAQMRGVFNSDVPQELEDKISALLKSTKVVFAQ